MIEKGGETRLFLNLKNMAYQIVKEYKGKVLYSQLNGKDKLVLDKLSQKEMKQLHERGYQGIEIVEDKPETEHEQATQSEQTTTEQSATTESE